MRRGNRFLLACIKLWGEEDRASAEEVRELAIGSPEEILYSVAHESGLAPVIYHVLRKRDLLGMIPDALRDRLKTFYHFNAARNAVIFRNLATFMKGAERRGFPVLMLKGCALIAAGYYPDKGLRFLSDLDVLVKTEDIAKAEELLIELGWTDGARAPLDEQMANHHHLDVGISPEGIPIEVHFRLTRTPLPIDLDRMWSRAKPIPNISPNLYCPSPEDILIHLALNTSYHHADKLLHQHLKFVADFEALAHGGDSKIDFGYVFDTARSIGAMSGVLHPLALSHKLLDQPWLAEALETSGNLDDAGREFINELASNILSGTRVPEMSMMVARMGEAKGKIEKIKTMLRIVFPKWDDLAEVYPQWARSRFFFLAYVQRIGHLILTFNSRNFSLAYRAGAVLNRDSSLKEGN